MRQLSLFETCGLAGVVPALRAAMRRVAGSEEGEGRKALVDSLNEVAQREGIRLTSGNSRNLSKDSLDKLLNPNESGHPPSINALVVFCRATNDVSPLRELLRPFGLDIMTAQDRRWRDIAKADEEIKALKKRKKMLEESK